MVIFDCDDFEVIQRSGGGELTLVTFSSLGMFDGAKSLANGNTFWAKQLADKLDLPAFGFVAKHRNWFCSPNMPEACAAVSDRLGSSANAVAYGSSMGGYAALRWGSACGTRVIVCFAPQTSIDPDVVSAFDSRYSVWFKPELHCGMTIVDANVSVPAYVLFDPSCTPDGEHVAMISSRVRNANSVPVYMCGHECVRAFARTEIAFALLKAALTGQKSQILDLVRVARKQAPIRAFEAATRLAATKPKLATQIYLKHRDTFEVLQSRVLLSALDLAHEKPSLQGQGNADIQNQVSARAPANGSDHFIENKGKSMTTPRIVHVHVPKTAGTALRSAFETQFKGAMRTFPHWDEASYADVDPADYDFFSGHIGYETAARLGGQLVTVLRNPVDRFVSVYFFWRQLYERGVERSFNTELASKYSLSEFVRIRDQPGLIEEFQNRCTYQIALGSALAQRRRLRAEGKTDDDIFRLATDNLNKFTVVGIQENMAGVAQAIKTKLGVELGVKRINVTESRSDLTDISMTTRHAMHDWLYMDIELYAHALRL